MYERYIELLCSVMAHVQFTVRTTPEDDSIKVHLKVVSIKQHLSQAGINKHSYEYWMIGISAAVTESTIM